MHWKDKLGLAKQRSDEAKAIYADEALTAEEKTKRIDALMAEAQQLRAEAAQLRGIEQFGAEIVSDIEEGQAADEAKGRREDPTEFKSWAEYLQAVHDVGNPKYKGPVDPRLQYFKEEAGESNEAREAKQMRENVGATGGFLVPTEFLAQLQAVIGESAIVRNRATTIRMRRRAILVPVLDQTGTTAGVPHWFGGMQFYWHEEAQSKTLTEPNFRQVELVAYKLIGYTRASDELLDDAAISISDFLAGPLGMAGGIAWMEDFAFLRGTGAGQPLGVITAVNQPTIVVARAAAGTVGFADLANMMENFLPSGRGVWVITQSLMSELIQLAGPAGNPSYIWQPNARDGIPGSILGFPVIWSEKNPIAGVQGDVLLADFRYYLVGDRQATTVESTQFDRWRYDETSWRAVHRVDGQPWLSAPLTYQDGTTQVSPFVILGDVAAS